MQNPPPLIYNCYADNSSGGEHYDTELPLDWNERLLDPHTPRIGDQVPLRTNGAQRGLTLGRGPMGDHSSPNPAPERGPMGDHSSSQSQSEVPRETTPAPQNPERGPMGDPPLLTVGMTAQTKVSAPR